MTQNLEKEFEPEFTPARYRELANFKVYLKLMIDGVSSRPFSAKTLSTDGEVRQ